MNEDKKPIQERYQINVGTIDRINQFKQFVGPDKFELILQGAALVDIPLEEERYVELLEICLDGDPKNEYLKQIPYSDAEEIISFFVKPFAGRYLRQAKYTLSGISSLLQNLDSKQLRTLMEPISSRKKNGSTSGASSSQTETSQKESGSIDPALQQNLPN